MHVCFNQLSKMVIAQKAKHSNFDFFFSIYKYFLLLVIIRIKMMDIVYRTLYNLKKISYAVFPLIFHHQCWYGRYST